jgi:hypothetical protein
MAAKSCILAIETRLVASTSIFPYIAGPRWSARFCCSHYKPSTFPIALVTREPCERRDPELEYHDLHPSIQSARLRRNCSIPSVLPVGPWTVTQSRYSDSMSDLDRGSRLSALYPTEAEICQRLPRTREELDRVLSAAGPVQARSNFPSGGQKNRGRGRGSQILASISTGLVEHHN